MSLPVDKLNKSLKALQHVISSNPTTGTLTRKSNDQNARIKTEIQRIKAIFLSTDLSTSESRGTITKIMQLLIGFLHNVDENIRSLAYETFLAFSRHLILIGQDTRLLLILITELGDQPHARAVAAVFTTLSKTIRLAKARRLEIFSTHILMALDELVRRPEEAIHLAIIAHLPTLFKSIGPVVNKLSIPRKDVSLPFEQRSVALKVLHTLLSSCLDVRGSANRSAVISIIQLSIHSPLCFQKTVSFCTDQLTSLDDQSNSIRLTAAINILKGLFEIIMKDESLREKTNVRKLVCILLCFTHSSVNEVLIASFECLSIVFPLLTKEQLSFYPPDIILSSEGPSTEPPLLPSRSINSSPFLPRRLLNQQNDSLQSTPPSVNSSLMDIPSRIGGTGSQLEFDQLSINTTDSAVNGTEVAHSPSHSWDSRENEEDTSEIIDPLMHSELYEEELSRRAEEDEDLLPSSPISSSTVLQQLPDIFKQDPRKDSIFLPEYTIFLITYRFLLQEESQGLISDQKARVSHKMLALSLITFCAAKSSQVLSIGAPIGGRHQNLHALTSLIYHSDEKLAALAINFIATAQFAAGEKAELKDCKDWFGFAWSRLSTRNLAPTRRALLHSITGKQEILERIDLIGKAIILATSSVNINFGHLKTSMASFLCSLDWSLLSSSLRSSHQLPSLDCLIRLLAEKDPHVVAGVAKLLPKFVENADFGGRHDHFMLDLPENPLDAFPQVPMVVGIPSTFDFTSSSPQRRIEKNLMTVIQRIMETMTSYRDAGMADPSSIDQMPGLISALSSLSLSFPPSLFPSTWSSLSVHSHGLLSILVDVADSSAHSPAFLAKILRLQATLMAGHFSTMINEIVAGTRSAKERDASPPMGDTVLYEKMIVMPMRVLNLYYCIAEDRRLELSGRQALTLGPKPVKELRGTERIASYSRLGQTGIVMAKNSAFNESPSLLGIVPQLRGAFRNYLDSVDEEHELKMSELLEGAVDLLSTLLEMHSLNSIRSLVPELMLYVDYLCPFSPVATTRISTQLLKSIFGRNVQTINIGHLKSLKTEKLNDIKSDNEIAEYLYQHELQSLRSRLTERETIDNAYKAHFGWLLSPNTVVAPPATTEVNMALRYFESFITRVVSIYGNTTEVETKRAMLSLFIQLRQSGIEFDLVDPNKKVIGAVEEELGHLIMPELIRDVFSFLIVLARSGTVKWSVLKLHALALCNSIEESKHKEHILDGLELVLHEFLVVRKETPFEITSLLFNLPLSTTLLSHSPSKYLQLFHMYLRSKENNEESYRATSCNLLKQLTVLFNQPTLPEYWLKEENAPSLISSLLLVFSLFPPSTLLPMDDFVSCLKSIVLHPSLETKAERAHSPSALISLSPILFLATSNIIEEEKFVHRAASYFDGELSMKADWIFRPLARALKHCIESYKEERREGEREDKAAPIRAAALMLRTLAVSNRPLLLEQFIISCHDEELLTPSLITFIDRLTPEWMGVLAQFKENDRVANLLVDSFDIIQKRDNHRALTLVSLQILVRYISRHRFPGSSHVKELKEKILLQEGTRMQLELMQAMRQPSIEDEFVRSLEPELAQKFLNLALKDADRGPLRSHSMSIISHFIEVYDKIHRKGKITMKRTEGRRHRRLNHKPAEVLGADSSFEVLVTVISKADRFHSSFVPAVLEMEEREMMRFVDRMHRMRGKFSPFITTVLCTAVKMIEVAGADAPLLSRLRLAVKTFAKCIYNLDSLTESEATTLFANISPLILLRVETSILDEYVEHVEMRVETITRNLDNSIQMEETLSMAQYFLQHPNTMHAFMENPLAHLHLIHRLTLSLLSLAERETGMDWPSRERTEIFSVQGVDIESPQHDQLFDLYHSSQFLMSLFYRSLLSSSSILGIAVRSLLRLPIINSFALTPKTAIDGGWTPVFEIQGKTVSVPLPPIHKLNDLDVLDDFTWRCFLLGWTSRQQFESVWVSLVGVLSSTPSGDELKSEMALDAVLVSTLAIRRITSYLLLTQLEPQPGNPIRGRFKPPSRDIHTTFSEHENYNRLCQLLGDLTSDSHPETILKRSIEWSIGSRQNHSVFHLDQLGIADLWTRVGLENERTGHQMNALRVTSTFFLDQLRIELDAPSAVRSLYENFSHWFSRGIDVIPIELLGETLRSIVVLSDLFEDVTSFESLNIDMRMLSHSVYISHGDEFGLILLAQAKAIAVIGPEEFTEDHWKRIHSLLSSGLDHKRSGVRCSTIRAALFILQASYSETLTDIVKYLVEWLLRELEHTAQLTDPIFNSGDHTSIEYRILLWSLAFRLIEHPSRVPAKAKLFQIVIDVFLSSSPSSLWQMEALTIGLGELVIHSQTFAPPVMRTAISSIEKFSAHPSRLHFALRLLSIAVHRENGLLKDFHSILPTLMETSRMCETNEVGQIVKTCIALKSMEENQLETLRWLSSLIFTPSSRPHPQPHSMLHSLYSLTRSIRATRIEAGLLDLSRELIASSQSRQRTIVLSLSLAASSPFTQFVHLYESLRLFVSSTLEEDWNQFLRHYKDIISE